MVGRLTTAVHEAGHVWAYYRAGKPIRYATVRPREGGLSGVTRPWRPRRMDRCLAGWIASAGPVAEAIHVMGTDREAWDFEWTDYLTGAILVGGCSDLSGAAGLLDSVSVVVALRAELEADWASVVRLADRLADVGTVPGAEAAWLLGHGVSRRYHEALWAVESQARRA